MLDHVGPVDLLRVDARLRQRPVEQLAGRTDERRAGLVLLVPRLLPHHHQLGILRAVTHDALDRVAVELTAAALLDSLAQGGQGRARRDPLLGSGPIRRFLACH